MINMGTPAINREEAFPPYYTLLQMDNPAVADGVIKSIELWFYITSTTVKVGTFYGSGTTYTVRNYVIIGTVTAGSKVTIPALLSVKIGDVIGIYFSDGYLENSLSGGTQLYAQADYFDGSPHSYSSAVQAASFAATGDELTTYLKRGRSRIDLSPVSLGRG